GSLSGSTTSNTPPKPNFLKSSGPPKTPDEKNDKDPAFPKLKPTANKFGGNQNTLEEGKPAFPKQPLKPKLSEAPKESEAKPMFPKPPLQKATGSSNLQDKETRPAVPKPAAVSKPPWLTDTAKTGETSTTSATPPKMPLAPKPKSSFKVLKAQADEGNTTDPAAKPFSGVSLKPSDNSEVSASNNKSEDVPKTDTKPLNARNAFLAKLNQDSSDEAAPSRKPPPQKLNFAAHKPDFPRKPSALGAQKENSDPSAPKRNPLPNIFALGSPPAKPNRPPNVNLEQFKKGAESATDAPAPGLKKVTPPPPPPPSSAHPSSHPALPLSSHPSVAPSPPNLPPRYPGAVEQIKLMNQDSLKNVIYHDGKSSLIQEDGSDGEMYEDLEESKELEKKREKEEKKRLEQEKKEQKEREKKEQDLKKRFKLTGPLEVIHKVKARVDCKGGKNDLMIKQGEAIDIIRITDNPEGRWLGRNKDGSYGYVKTESVEIDYDTLKRKPFGLMVSDKHPEDDGELYDDVASNEEVNRKSQNGSLIVLPPPPEEEDDIYHDPDNSELNVRGPPADFPKEKAAAPVDDEIYDDVESTPFPPPPLAFSLPKLKAKDKTEEKDLKKQKKFEKEEKEFRKKFKYDGEIQVLYQVTIVSTLTNKKWGGKDLPLKPGEVVDVIQKPVDNKMICRNEDGKFGYVLTSNIIAEDADIYDDIGEDCVYDND
uniref:FYN-binding protein 1 n=1 Tax=Lepisosteus oculatus TaxID=7918 RepID=W5N4E6_LEPOC